MQTVSGAFSFGLFGSTGGGFQDCCHSLAVFQEKVVAREP
jgi:hypothetical protein